jgi:protein-tyrosine sulfotransferase
MPQHAGPDRPPPSTDAPGVFVFSLPRTGSTLLRLILDTHPDVFCPDELNLGRLVRALYDTSEGLAEGAGTVAQQPAQIDPGSPGAVETRRLIAGMLGAAAARKGKSLWCDKSPSNLEHMGWIERLLPGSRFILLHRHCLDFAISCLRFSTYGFFLTVVGDYVRRDHTNFLRAVVRAWVEKTEELLRFEAEHPGRCHRLRYEDLVAAPETSVRALGEFLGVAFEPQLLRRVFSTAHHQRAFNGDLNALYSHAIVDRGVGRGAELEPQAFASIPAELLRQMNGLLETLGYPAVELTATGFDMHLGRGGAAAVAGAAAAHAADEVDDAKDGAAAPPAVPADAIFSMIGQRLNAAPTLAGQVNSSFKFVLGGQGGGTWVLDLTEPPGRVIADDAEARCVISASAADFVEIVSGRLNPAVAVKEGRMKLGGEVDETALRGLIGMLLAG